MATLQEQISNVRTSLGDPLPNAPGPRAIWQAIIRHSQSHYNQLNNVAANWATGETTVTVGQNVGDYQINVGDFGKALLVSTQDAANPGHWERWVPFYEAQNLLLSYDGPRDGANWFTGFVDGSFHTALGVAFIRDSANNITARFRPIPQATAIYNVLYAIGDWASTAGLGSIPVLPEHHHLIETKAALSVLPDATWWPIPVDASPEQQTAIEALNEGKRRNKERALMRDAQQFVMDFDHYKRSQTGAKITFKRSSYY